ncbi:MAG TPA: hotdog domain-containing protein [Actinomycetota bacterium]|jgi:predicted thioesterase
MGDEERWDLTPGLTGRVAVEVDEGRTARWLGSGDLDVLGTPSVVALAEAAACAAVAGRLPEGNTSVGTRVELDHVAPTVPGRVVTAAATLTSVDGRTLEFGVTVEDEAGVVARGRHWRTIVDRERFLVSARRRGGSPA